MKKIIELLEVFRLKKSFLTRGGLPIAKKMWRDGYNKAINDMITYIEMELEK